MGVVAADKIPSLKGKFFWETCRVLECTQANPPRNQHKGQMCLWLAGEVTESWKGAEQAALFPL